MRSHDPAIHRRIVILSAICLLMLAVCLSSCGDSNENWLWGDQQSSGLSTDDMVIRVTDTEPSEGANATPDTLPATEGEAATQPHHQTDPDTIPETAPATEPETQLPPVFPSGTDTPYTGEAHAGTDIRYTGTGKNRDTIIVIDAGHQIKGNSEKEPIGPGADTLQSKVSSGTEGSFSHLEEYALNLRVALALRDELIARGYSVVMIRETNEVNISNVERAQIANSVGADAFLRIHANGWDTADMKGAMTVCQTAENPYPDCRAQYAASRRLSEVILNAYCEASGISRRSIWETDTKAGTNWSGVPTTILELGFMTNREDDLRMAEEGFAHDAAVGIANGLDSFFAQN